MKQTLFDILIVSIVPLLIVTGYFTVQSGGIKNTFIMVTGATDEEDHTGEKVAEALTTLSTIRLDSSIFDLKEFKDMKAPETKKITEDTVGTRPNPFASDKR